MARSARHGRLASARRRTHSPPPTGPCKRLGRNLRQARQDELPEFHSAIEPHLRDLVVPLLQAADLIDRARAALCMIDDFYVCGTVFPNDPSRLAWQHSFSAPRYRPPPAARRKPRRHTRRSPRWAARSVRDENAATPFSIRASEVGSAWGGAAGGSSWCSSAGRARFLFVW